MERFFKGIIDYNKMTKWINDNAIKYSIPIIMTYDNENEKSK